MTLSFSLDLFSYNLILVDKIVFFDDNSGKIHFRKNRLTIYHPSGGFITQKTSPNVWFINLNVKLFLILNESGSKSFQLNI